MKVGDLVKINTPNRIHFADNQIGIVIGKKALRTEYRFDIVTANGKIINGIPERYAEIINEER